MHNNFYKFTLLTTIATQASTDKLVYQFLIFIQQVVSTLKTLHYLLLRVYNESLPSYIMNSWYNI